MTGEPVVVEIDRVSTPTVRGLVERLRSLRLYDAICKICARSHVSTVDVLGPSREPEHIRVRAEAWSKCVARGVSVEDVARLWQAEVAVVRQAVDVRQGPQDVSVELTTPIHVEPAGWLRSRGVLIGVQTICEKHGATLQEVFGRCRRRRIVAARHASWAWLRELGWSYPDIAEPWGVDHTSVMTALRKVAS